MSLAEALAAPPPSSYRRCAFRTWLDGLGAADRSAVDAALAARKDDGRYQWPARDLATAISGNGYTVSASTLTNHRNGTCATCRSLTP